MANVIFALRLAFGALLIVTGLLKVHDGPAATAATVAGYRLLPAAFVAPLGVALPYVELLLGAYLVLGLFTRVVAALASAQFVVFAGAVASLVVRGISADCGCFGSAVRTPPSWGHVTVDLGLALACAMIAARAPGAYALDRRLGLGGTGAPAREAYRT